MKIQDRNLIGGEWVGALAQEEFEVLDPATDEVIATVPCCGQSETSQAIEAASKAFSQWSQLPAAKRCKILLKFSELLMSNQERLAHLITREQGKPLSEAKGEVLYGAAFIEWAAEEGKRIYGETIPANFSDKRILVLRQPIGVTASITPWNFPVAMICRKMGPALAAGNTFICKPAEETPLSALALGELAMEAEIPPGVLNIITGNPERIGEELFQNKSVRKISFTGSTEVGKLLIKNSASNVTRLSLELGGHAPFIVFDDADIDRAVEGAIASKFRNMGQTCISANRFYIQEGAYQSFAEKLEKAISKLRVGRGVDEGVHIGPLINNSAVDKVEQHVADALSKGATLRCGGERVKINGLTDRFYAPTIIEHFDSGMKIQTEETFGPVAPLRKFSTEEEVIELANDSIYGLAAYFFTRDASRLMRVAEGLEYGIVGANDGAPSTAQAPFGGVKQSGYGREGGKFVMDEYTEMKYISWGL